MSDKEKARLQVNLKTVIKYFLAIFIPPAVLIGGMLLLFHHVETTSMIGEFKSSEKRVVQQEAKAITDDFRIVLSDLLYLAGQHGLKEIFKDGKTASVIDDLSRDYLVMSEKKRLYDQVRVLDKTGMEVLRVNFDNGNPYIVPEKQLQSKAHRYYFEDSFRLGRAEVYVSPLDLNIEKGEIELPRKPMIRFGTPFFDARGQKQGIILLNYFGEVLIKRFRMLALNSSGEVILLNSDGFWLAGPDADDEWGFMYDDGKNRSFGKKYPHAWLGISKSDSGQFQTSDGLFTYRTVYPLREVHEAGMMSKNPPESAASYQWTIVSRISPDLLSAGPYKLFNKLILLYIILLLLLAGSSSFLAYFIVRRRRSAEEIGTLTRAVEQSPASIMITDIEGKIEYVNPKFTEITGYSSNEVLGQNPRFLKTEDKRPSDYKLMWKKITSGKVWHGEFLNKKKSGELYWEKASISPVRDEKGVILHFVAVKEDVTERKRADKELKEAKEMAEAASKAKSEFLANMGHELRTPLNAIIGFSDVLLHGIKGEISEQQGRSLSHIKQSGKHLLEIVNDVLDIAKIEAGKVFIETVPFDMYHLMEEVCNMLSTLAEKNSLKLRMVYPDDMPKQVMGDPKNLRSIITNLANNAIKFTDEGDVSIKVESKEQTEKDVLFRISVEDSGIGIPADKLEHIFDKFSQVDASNSRNYEGTGLGLAICKQLVELMGGSIGVISQEGNGSTFWFTLCLPLK